MQNNRYIRAYHKNLDRIAFEIQLPSDALTFLSTLDFLTIDNNDVNLYCVYDLTKEQTDFIFNHFHLSRQAETDYFDYQLDCDVVENKVKTKEELFGAIEQDCVDFITDITGDSDSSFGLPTRYKQYLSTMQELVYKIYQQGVQDGRL